VSGLKPEDVADEFDLQLQRLSGLVATQQLTVRYVQQQLVQNQQFLDRAARLLKRAGLLLVDAQDETALLHEIGAFLAQLGVDRVPYEPGTPP